MLTLCRVYCSIYVYFRLQRKSRMTPPRLLYAAPTAPAAALAPILAGIDPIAEANRIFGLDRWDRETLEVHCLREERRPEGCTCVYVTRVRVRVRTGGDGGNAPVVVVVRD